MYLRRVSLLVLMFITLVTGVAWAVGVTFHRWPLLAPLRDPTVGILTGTIWFYGAVLMPFRIRMQVLLCIVPAWLLWYGASSFPAFAFMRDNPHAPLVIATFMTLGLLYGNRRHIEPQRLTVALDLLLILACIWKTFVLLALTMTVSPVYDFYLLTFEKSAGLLGVRHFVDAFDDPGMVRIVLTLFYMGLAPLALALVVEERLRGQKTSFALMYFLATIVGYTMYYLLPAVGPLVALPDYPVYPTHIAPVPFWSADHEFSPRNAWPSLHTTWALFMIYRAFLLPPVSRTFYVIAGSGIVVATMVLHMHWITDLFAAFPLSVLAYSLSRQLPNSRTEGRWIVELFCLVLLLTWLVMLRTSPTFFEGHMQLARLFIAITVIGPLAGLWWLGQTRPVRHTATSGP